MRSGALITCVVAGVKYLIHPQKLGSIDADIDADALVPVTLLTTSQIFDGNVDNLLLLYDIYDDVFTPEFGAVLVEKTPANTTDYLDDSALVARVHRLAENSTTRDFEQLPSGPYFLYGPNLYQAWRLYEDDLDAFTMGVIPEDIDSPDTFRTLTSLTENGSHRLVAVPSKLYHPPPGPSGPDKPLSGVRIAVSDAIAVKGVPRTLSSRAWSAIHPEGSQKSAQVVKELVSRGAVVVGKTKTAQFTAGRDWVDVSAPFSPRGDHYHRPAGSSAGAFASLTGYDWLRHVLADDAQGSSLDLSAQEGAFSLRPSPELLSREGSTSVSPSLSGLTVSSRLLDQLLQIAKAVLKPISASTEPISSLIRIIDLETDLREDEMALYEQFVQTLENYLGVKSTPWNLTALWELDPPTVTKQNTLRESMNQMSLKSFALEFYRTFSGFRTTYQKIFKRKPYIEPTVKEYWAIGANVTEGDIEVAAQSLQDFKDWFMEHFLAKDATAAIVLPVHQPDTIYRDEPLPHMAHNVFTYSGLSALLGIPSLVAPYAQSPYESDISGREEYLPIASSVLGSPGSDIALLELVQKAYHLAQWRTKVDTGRLAFPVADNQRNVDDQHMSEDQHASFGGGLDSRQAVEKDVQWAPLEL